MNEYSESTKFIDLASQQKLIRSKLEEAINKVLDHGNYIMGPEVQDFEKELCTFTGAKHAISCANGTDALSLVLMAWGIGPGDAVFVPSFTYVASAEAPAQLGATPFLVDVDENTFNIDPLSLKQAILDCKSLQLKPKVVIAVDLFGQPADIDVITEIVKEEGIKLLVDAAQSFGAEYKSKNVGVMGDATTTSFFPAKPLGCYGDGGAVFTQSDDLACLINSIRLHGKGSQKYDNVRIGLNSRLDSIQAAILIEKLKIFPKELLLREKIAEIYTSKLSEFYRTPKILSDVKSAWAQYTMIFKNRDFIQDALSEKNIPSVVYYPKSLSQQDGYKNFPKVSSGLNISHYLSDTVLSLPMHPYLKQKNQNKIIDTLIKLS